MLNRIKEGYDIVIGSRFINQKKEKSLRMIGSKMLTVAIKITTGKRVADPTSGMRMFSHKMIKEFELWTRAGYCIIFVEKWSGDFRSTSKYG